MNLTKETDLDLIIFEYLKYEYLKEAGYVDPNGDYLNLVLQIDPIQKETILLYYLEFLENKKEENIIVLGYKDKIYYNNVLQINSSSDISHNKNMYNPFCVCIIFDYKVFDNHTFKTLFSYYFQPMLVIRLD